MEGVTSVCDQIMKRESTQELRDWSTKEFENKDNKLKEFQNEDNK